MIVDVEAFRRDGFLILDNALDEHDIADVGAAVHDMEGLFDSDGELYDALAQTPAMYRIAGARKTQTVANRLLGRHAFEPLYCFTNRCRIDRPHDDRRTYGWHRETYYTIPRSRFVQTWAPLVEDVTVEMGAIEVCPGSHRAEDVAQEWREEAGRATQIIVDPAAVARYEPRAVPMRLGQMMFFDSRLFHRSGQNTSDRTRCTLIGMYHDPSAPGFRAPSVRFEYRGQTPREFFDLHHPQPVSEET